MPWVQKAYPLDIGGSLDEHPTGNRDLDRGFRHLRATHWQLSIRDAYRRLGVADRTTFVARSPAIFRAPIAGHLVTPRFAAIQSLLDRDRAIIPRINRNRGSQKETQRPVGRLMSGNHVVPG